MKVREFFSIVIFFCIVITGGGCCRSSQVYPEITNAYLKNMMKMPVEPAIDSPIELKQTIAKNWKYPMDKLAKHSFFTQKQISQPKDKVAGKIYQQQTKFKVDLNKIEKKINGQIEIFKESDVESKEGLTRLGKAAMAETLKLKNEFQRIIRQLTEALKLMFRNNAVYGRDNQYYQK